MAGDLRKTVENVGWDRIMNNPKYQPKKHGVSFFFFSVEHEITGSIFWSIMLHLPYAPTIDFQGQSFNGKCKLQKNMPGVISPVEKSHAKQLL